MSVSGRGNCQVNGGSASSCCYCWMFVGLLVEARYRLSPLKVKAFGFIVNIKIEKARRALKMKIERHDVSEWE